MTSISEKVLKKIEKKEITPKPKWIFGLQNLAIWFSSLIFLLIGGFAFSIVFYMIRENDWEVYGNINNSLVEFTLLTLPYFWIVVLVGLVWLAKFNLKNTKKGYKYRLLTIVVFVLFVSMMLGAGLHALGAGKAMDEAFSERVPFYEEYVNKVNQDKKRWMNPEKGLLTGVVILNEDENKFTISDFNRDVWIVESDEKTITKGFDLKIEDAVKIIGEEVVNDEALSEGSRAFLAKTIMIMPGKDLLKRHPGMKSRMMEIRADIGRRVSPASLIHEEYSELSPEELAEMAMLECQFDSDCLTPFSFMMRSNCPFESKCIEEDCRVICPKPYETREDDKNKKPQCEHNLDCDCEYYSGKDKKECVCLGKMCAVIVD